MEVGDDPRLQSLRFKVGQKLTEPVGQRVDLEGQYVSREWSGVWGRVSDYSDTQCL